VTVAEPGGGFPITSRPLRQLLGPLGVSAGGMSRQQKFIEVIATNIANAETTRTAAGGPYQRQVAVAGIDPATGASTTQVVTDQSTGRLVYDPGHPDADATGYVRYPNVDLATETVDLMIARRLHEANATVFQAAKAMLRRALDI
jgi:flagellar basal-body rod protein FlgC